MIRADVARATADQMNRDRKFTIRWPKNNEEEEK